MKGLTTTSVVPLASTQRAAPADLPGGVVLEAREAFAETLNTLTGPAREHRASFGQSPPARNGAGIARRGSPERDEAAGDPTPATIPSATQAEAPAAIVPDEAVSDTAVRREPGSPSRHRAADGGAPPEEGGGAVGRRQPAVLPGTAVESRADLAVIRPAARSAVRPVASIGGTPPARSRGAGRASPAPAVRSLRRSLTPEMLRDQIFDKVRLRLASGRATAEIRLDPPDLGRLSIEIDHHEGKMVASVKVEHDAVAEVVQRYVGDLRELFLGAGIVVDHFEVIRERAGRRGGAWTSPRGRGRRSRAGEAVESDAGSRQSGTRATKGIVDVFV